MYADDHFKNDGTGETPAPSTVKALLIANAYQYNLSKAKRIQQGWGMADLKQIYDTAGDHLIINETTALKTGQEVAYSVYPIGTQPLKITLTWTDYWGTTSATKHLINDLNLNVTDPNGKQYFGNFGLNTSLWSPASSTPRPDRLNNVENVFIENPVMGEWKIKINGYNVVQDADIRTPVTDQAFALVASGVKQDWHEHDLAVTHITAPDYAIPDTAVMINASVFNFGMKDESNINVNLTVNGTTINFTTIGTLKNLTGTDIEFQWYPPTGVHDVCVDVTPVTGENRTNNNNWTKILIAEPDVRISNLLLPEYGVLNADNEVLVTVENPGQIPLTKINITLSENGTAVNWTELDLPATTDKELSINWTPLLSGQRDITVTAKPHVNESMIDDNSMNGTVLVTPYEPLRVFVLDSWGADNPGTWDDIGQNWQTYGGRPIRMNSTGFKDKEVVYSDLVNVSADVLVISAAYASFSDWEYSDSEIDAIIRYTEEGHGLVVTSITFYFWAQNNYKLAPLMGISNDASSSFSFVTTGDKIDTYFNTHPLFYNVPSTWAPGTASTALPSDGAWDDMDMNAGAIVAGNNVTGRSTVIDNHGIYYISNWLENTPAAIDYQFLYNAINTSKYTKYNVDVALRNLSGPGTNVPVGEITLYNVSVHNIGNQVLNNVNVTLYVNDTLINYSVIPNLPIGTYMNLSLGWPAVKLGMFSAYINVSQQPGETYIYDNIRKHSGSVVPNPEISISPSNLELELNETETVHRILQIDNTGFSELSFSLSADEVWISTNLSGGFVPVGKSQLVNLTFNAGSLLKGQYFGNITILSDDIDEPVLVIPVHMFVYGQLRYIKLTPESGTTHTDLAVQFIPTGYNMTHGVVGNLTLTWETTDPAGIITNAGLYFPGTIGNWTIYCNETGGAVSNYTIINVTPSTLDHIDIDPTSWSGTADETQQFTATGRDDTNGIVLFTSLWATTDPWGTVTDGLYRPGRVGTWLVFASNFRSTITEGVSVEVSPGALVWIDISPSTWSGKSSETVQFTATGYDAHDNIAPFTQSWSTDDPKGVVTNTGFYTAGTNGSWQLTCANIGQTITKTVFVDVVPGDLNSIMIDPGLVNITADDTYQFKAVGLDLNDNPLPINATWSISGGGSINNDTGLFVADNAGDWLVYAFFAGHTYQAVVNITYGQLANIQVSPQNSELKPDNEIQYSAYGFDSDFNPRPTSPTWDTEGGGLINPVSGLFKAKWSGTWKVYANDSGVSGFTNVIVTAGDLSMIIITPQGPDIIAGNYINFDAEGRDTEGNSIVILPTWDVDGGGTINPSSGQYFAETAGIWTVTARVGQFKGSTSITIKAGVLDRIVVEPSSPELTADDTEQFTAKGYDGFSNNIDVTVKWSTSGGGVINPTGLFTPKTVGRWAVTATYMNLSGTSTVVVLPGKAANIVVTPVNPSVKLLDTITFSANITDSHGNVINEAPNWTINETAGVISKKTGAFTAKGPGVWNVTATYGPAVGITEVTILLGFDTDSDGMSDQWEIDNGLDPLRGSDATENRDDDALSNLEEFQNGTDPFNEDTDSDTIDDYWEAFFDLDPNDPNDADDDNDGDGYTNLEEYEALTDPNDPESYPEVKEPETGETGIDRFFLWMIIMIVVIVIIAFVIGVFIYYRRRPAGDADKKPGEPPEVIDVQYEFDEDSDDYIDFDDKTVPPPPPPPGSSRSTRIPPPPPPPPIIDVDYVPGGKRGKKKEAKKKSKKKRGKKKRAEEPEIEEPETDEPEEEDSDDISWDDDHRYGRSDEETEIEWDDDDGKPYSKAKKKYDDDISWDD
jgi:hypothetical protein